MGEEFEGSRRSQEEGGVKIVGRMQIKLIYADKASKRSNHSAIGSRITIALEYIVSISYLVLFSSLALDLFLSIVAGPIDSAKVLLADKLLSGFASVVVVNFLQTVE